MKKLSIITVCLNNKEGLERTIKSVAGQSFSDFEFLIVDGGSTDGSYKVIQDNLDYIDYWISEKDNGIYDAMNKGIKAAKGEYCLFLNSDDVLASPNCLQKVYSKNPKADILYGNLAIIKYGKLKKAQKYLSRIDEYSFYRTQSSIHQQAAFIKKSVFDLVGLFKTKYKIIADWVFFFEAIILNECTYKHYNIVISVFTAEGISSTATNILREKTQIERQTFLEQNLSAKMIERLERNRKFKESKIFNLKRRIYSKMILYVFLMKNEIDIRKI